jgi:LmbE family N-acetylglucosaminyl deacetylase
MSAGPAVVAVVAHPDDEALIAGGTLALAAAAGLRTGVVSLTRGELGPIAEGSMSEGEQLAEARERELRDSAHALGVDWARCLRHPDGELAWADTDAVAAQVADLLGGHGPTILLTFAADGLYGHPDHVATRTIALRCAELLTQPAAVLEACWPIELVPRLVAAAETRELPADLWGLEPSAFGSAPREPSVSIDVRPYLDRKLRALRAHRTQLNAGHLLAALPEDLAERFLGVETWHTADARDLDALRALSKDPPSTGEPEPEDG